MSVFSVAGSTVEIGAAMATKSTPHVAADFTTPMGAGSAKVIGEPETIGTIGDTWETEEFVSATDARGRTIKTIRKGDTFELTCGADPADVGQIAMRAACDAVTPFGFRISFGDKPLTGASPKASTRQFVALVLSVTDDPSGKLGKVKYTCKIESNVVATAASAT